MGYYHFFVLGSLGLLTFIVVIWAVNLKKTIGIMRGMIISMFYGMNVGLTAGVLLGVTYQGDLFLSTIFSITIGVLAGSLCGLCFGMLSVLEGFMAGLMGGMMGAMVGEMIRVDQSISLIQIFLLLSFSTLFVIPILKTPKGSKVKSKKWILKPLTLATFTFLTVMGSNSIAERFEGQKELPSKTIESAHNKGQTIVLETADMKYSRNKIIVEKDKLVTLTLKNLDNIEHDIEIRTSSFNMITQSKHNHGESKGLIHLHALPENTETLSFTITEAGIYEFYCTIPGHKEVGMIGQFIVS
ncbi:copper-binding protein [Sporosarcina sp. P37]|uniref:plastocyanin/azurin family copper-binding protein n=1 Tax=unclassified Sporosarcina TaxID=2647733 RepID=UPI000A17CC74|nr:MULTISPECIES: plastocyanin/azurin family copper-binding protein [unclassified Sporosarcina]ARK24117.1 copper-binding protein [Sporosarcina sp. P37]PID17387.1 copper-binding protein [Sporosarcina sp. P35]